MFPRFLIDDTSALGDARVFVCHTRRPRFVGELVPSDEAPPGGLVLAINDDEDLVGIDWIDPPTLDLAEIARALGDALADHWAVRDRSQ